MTRPPDSPTGAPTSSRFRPLFSALRISFALALIGSVALGAIVVIVQLVGLFAGSGGLISGISSALTPVAFALAGWACLASLLVSYAPTDEPQAEVRAEDWG